MTLLIRKIAYFVLCFGLMFALTLGPLFVAKFFLIATYGRWILVLAAAWVLPALWLMERLVEPGVRRLLGLKETDTAPK